MVAMVAMAAVSIMAGLMGNMKANKSRKAAQDSLNEALERFHEAGLPPDLSKEIIYEQFEQAGILTPEMEEDINIAESRVANITEDNALRDSQIGALNLLKERSISGLGAEERAGFNEIRQEAATDAEAKRQQILQNQQARGMGGGGAELITQLQAAQDSAQIESEGGDRMAAMAAQNALRAMSESGQLAGNVRSQDLSVSEMKARAVDELNRFRAQNQMVQQQRNIDRANQAAAENLYQKQLVQDRNLQMANQEKLRQEQAKRQYWLDKMSRASAMAGQNQAMAQNQMATGAAKQQMWGGIGQAVNTGIGAYAGSQKSPSKDDKDDDEDIR